MAAKSTELCYKGHPLRRKDNLIYYGSMADKYIIMLQVMDNKKVDDDLSLATKVSVQLQLTDDIPQCGGSEVLNGVHGVLHPIGKEFRVCNLIVQNSVNLHGHVVLGNHRLGRKVSHLFLQGDHP